MPPRPVLSPALKEYREALYKSWRETGDTSDKTIAQKLGIEAESVRQRRVRLYELTIIDGKHTIPNLLRHFLKDAQIL